MSVWQACQGPPFRTCCSWSMVLRTGEALAACPSPIHPPRRPRGRLSLPKSPRRAHAGSTLVGSRHETVACVAHTCFRTPLQLRWRCCHSERQAWSQWTIHASIAPCTPTSSRRSMSAPLASRTFTTSSRPLLMAQWSAVRPLCRWRPGVSAQRGRQRPNGLGATYTVARIHLCPCVEQRLDTTLATFTRCPNKGRIAELARNRLSVHWSTRV